MPRSTRVWLAIVTFAWVPGCTEPDLETETADPALKASAPADQASPVDDVEDTECSSPKVFVCHIPPGNPGNAHNICIAQSAVQAHVNNHGDAVGTCNPPAPPPPPPPPVCLPRTSACSLDQQCCSNRCANDACIDRV